MDADGASRARRRRTCVRKSVGKGGANRGGLGRDVATVTVTKA